MPHDHTAQAALTVDRRLMLSDIHKLTGRDRKTLTKDIRDGRFPSALKSSKGRGEWTVAIRDLVEVGLLAPEAVIEVPAALDLIRDSEEVVALRVRIAQLEGRLEAVTALAEERRTTIEWQRELLLRPERGGGPCPDR